MPVLADKLILRLQLILDAKLARMGNMPRPALGLAAAYTYLLFSILRITLLFQCYLIVIEWVALPARFIVVSGR